MTEVEIADDDYMPIFEQVRSQLERAIRDGRVKAGERLPTVRQLAGDLGIAPNTVARAYRELEIANVIETRGRKGTFARSKPVQDHPDETATMKFIAQRYLDAARELGVLPMHALAFLDRFVAESRVCGD